MKNKKYNIYKNLIMILLLLYFFLIAFDFIISGYIGRALSTYISLFIFILGIPVIINNKKMKFKIPYLVLLLYAFYILLNMLITRSYNFSNLVFIMYYILTLKYYLILIDYFDFKVSSFFISYILGFVVVFILFNDGFVIERGRLFYLDLAGNYLNPNSLSVYLIIGLMALYYLINNSNRKISLILYTILTIITIIILILTQSRTAIISFFLSIILTFILVNFLDIIKQHGRLILNIKFIYKIITLFIVVAILLSTIYIFNFELSFTNPLNLDRYRFLTEGFEAMSAGRVNIWRRGLDKIDNPIIGIGFSEMRNIYRSPHNIYIGAYIDTGLIGLLILILFFGTFIMLSLRNIKNYNKKISYLIIFVAFYIFISGFGNDTIYYKYFWVLLIFYELICISGERRISSER